MTLKLICMGVLLGGAVTATADTVVHYDWLTQGEKSGELVLTLHDDGRRSVAFEFNDRGRGPKMNTVIETDSAGLVQRFQSGGNAYMGAPIEEVFEHANNRSRWTSTLEAGEAEGALRSFYLANDSTPEYLAVLVRALLQAPDRQLPMWPAGTATLEVLGEERVDHEGQSKTATLYAVSGLGFDPQYLWLDEDNELFALAMGWMGMVPAGWADVLPALDARQQEAEQALFRQRAEALTVQLPASYCLRDFAVVDVDAGRRHEGSTVRVDDGVIAAVGSNDSINCYDRVTIDGEGRSLIPGLWDMHVHVGAADGAMHIAGGVTTVRDLANTHDRLMDTIDQFEQGKAIGPRVYRSGFIDASGPFAAPTGNLADSLDDALAYIEEIHEQGYPHIKIYSSIEPDWVAPMADAIHERGMRLSGHVPSGMTAEAAIRAGFDEIQHINMVFLNFLAGPDDDTRTPVRFVLVAEEGRCLDLDSEEGPGLHRPAGPGRRGGRPDRGDLRQHVPPSLGRDQPVLRDGRGSLSAERAPLDAGRAHGHQRRQRRALCGGGRALLEMIRRLHEAGVPLVAGTDALAGFTLHRELELYARPAFRMPMYCASRRSVRPKVVGDDDRIGRIAPGLRRRPGGAGRRSADRHPCSAQDRNDAGRPAALPAVRDPPISRHPPLRRGPGTDDPLMHREPLSCHASECVRR
jgi:hypothetical protein